MIYVGGDTQSLENDFYTKTAGSMADCNMEVYHADVDVENLPNPTLEDGSINPIWNKINNQELINKIKEQNSDQTIETETNTFEGNVFHHNAPCDGSMSVMLEGQTLKNEVVNGNFSDGTGWSEKNSIIYANDNKITITGNGTAFNPRISQTINFVGNHKYFIKVKIKVTNNVCTATEIYLGGGGTTIQVDRKDNPVKNEMYLLHGIVQVETSLPNGIFISNYYADSATANGKVMEVKDVICLDLTSLGLEDKTVEELNLMTQTYFEGIKSVAEVDKHITTDFKNKESGSTVENGNIYKYKIMASTLIPPSSFPAEGTSTSYSNIKSLDGNTTDISSGDTNIPQQLFSFNLISETERKWGREIPTENGTVAEKVQWLKDNVKKITCNWWGYGSCPSGNLAKICRFQSGEWHGAVDNWSNCSHEWSKPSLLKFETSDSVPKIIDSDGFIHYLAYTEASDGTTSSTIYTDYVNLEIELKPEVEVCKEIGVLSINKNIAFIEEISKNQYIDKMIYKNKECISWICGANAEKLRILQGRFKKNTQYTISGLMAIESDVTKFVIKYTDGTKDLYTISNNDFEKKIFVSSPNKTIDYLRGTWNSNQKFYIDINTFQIEQGTQATEYVAPIFDKIDILTSKPLDKWSSISSGGIATYGGKKITITEEMISSVFTNFTNVDGVVCNLPKMNDKNVQDKIIINKKNVYDNKDSLDSIGGYYANPTNIIFIVAKGTTLEEAKANLSGIEIHYELADEYKTTEKVSPLLLQSFKGGTLELTSDIPPVCTETHNVDIADYSVLTLSCNEAGKAKAILISTDLSNIANSLYGGSNSALKSALKSVSSNSYISKGKMRWFYFTTGNWWNDSIGDMENLNTNIESVYRNFTQDSTTVRGFIDTSNKIYILLLSSNPATTDTPSILNLDYVNVNVDIERSPDKIEPIPVELENEWSLLMKGFSPSWDNTDSKTNRRIFNIGNGSLLDLRWNVLNKFQFTKYGDTKTTTMSITPSPFKKYETHNFLIGQNNEGMFLYILKNNDTVKKVVNTDTQFITGIKNLFVGKYSNVGLEADAFIDNLYLFNNKVFTDEEAEVLLKGRNDIVGKENDMHLNQLAEQFEAPNLIPKFDDERWIIHENASVSSDGKTLILNATDKYQGNAISIPILPNNKYEVAFNSNIKGYADVLEFSSNYRTTPHWNIGCNNEGLCKTQFITDSHTNRIALTLTSSKAGTFTFSDFELRRLD